MKTPRRFLGALMALGLVMGAGCSQDTEIAVIDPGKVELPPPPKSLDPNGPGKKAPSSGGSPSGLPSEYTRVPGK